MRNDSHNTLIGTIRAAVVEWRKREGWSRESVVQEIVAKHEEIDGPTITDITFDPNTRDAFQRLKVNADRVFRWLDDESKDTNLLPVNFLPSILAALPIDLRLQVVGGLIRPLGLEVRSSEHAETPAFNPMVHASSIIKEGSEAAQAVLKVGAGASQDVIEQACKELADVREAAFETERALRAGAARA
ncbi:hypothetical protein IM543_11365 [Massilia sp. UMI-21]|nr:hypothetical protein IM543_11365 [Massilia sp. UMI-21]